MLQILGLAFNMQIQGQNTCPPLYSRASVFAMSCSVSRSIIIMQAKLCVCVCVCVCLWFCVCFCVCVRVCDSEWSSAFLAHMCGILPSFTHDMRRSKNNWLQACMLLFMEGQATQEHRQTGTLHSCGYPSIHLYLVGKLTWRGYMMILGANFIDGLFRSHFASFSPRACWRHQRCSTREFPLCNGSCFWFSLFSLFGTKFCLRFTVVVLFVFPRFPLIATLRRRVTSDQSWKHFERWLVWCQTKENKRHDSEKLRKSCSLAPNLVQNPHELAKRTRKFGLAF